MPAGEWTLRDTAGAGNLHLLVNKGDGCRLEVMGTERAAGAGAGPEWGERGEDERCKKPGVQLGLLLCH